MSYISTQIKSPSLYGLSAGSNYWLNIKHQRVIEHNGYLYHASGDFQGWPFGAGKAGFPPNPADDPFGYDGRQDLWRAEISSAALSAGLIEWELAQNAYHNYPWNGTSGHFGPGNPGGGALPERGPYSPDALGWVVDKRGEFWMGPCTVGYTTTYKGEAAGQDPGYPAMFKWNLPGVHSNGVRYGNGWSLPAQDRLEIDVPVWGGADAKGYGRPNDSAYDPLTDAIYVVAPQSSNSNKTFNFQLLKFSCVPNAGKHSWTKFDITIPMASLNAPAVFSSANNDYNIGSCAIVGRWFYFPFLVHYNGVSNPNFSGGGGVGAVLRRSTLVAIHLDTRQVMPIPYPAQQNWWLRTWDGPLSDSYPHPPLTPGQNRQLRALNNKLICGPDGTLKIGTDPWLSVYDPATAAWTLYNPPTDHDWPGSLGTLVAVHSLNEAWLIGNLRTSNWDSTHKSWAQANGLHVPPDNAGRHVVRFKVT